MFATLKKSVNIRKDQAIARNLYALLCFGLSIRPDVGSLMPYYERATGISVHVFIVFFFGGFCYFLQPRQMELWRYLLGLLPLILTAVFIILYTITHSEVSYSYSTFVIGFFMYLLKSLHDSARSISR